MFYRYEKYVFYLVLLLALSIIIIPKYYITGDGSSHVYNAKVLFDYLFNHERAFYKEFYAINRDIDANWMSHIILGALLQVLPAWLADKSFQLIYLLSFAFGFRYLIQSIQKENSFLSLLFFPFVFTLPFQEGFYNYALSISFLFWTLAYFIRHSQQLDNAIRQMTCGLLLLITTFTHSMVGVYVMVLLFGLWSIEQLTTNKQFTIRQHLESFIRLVWIESISLFMVLLFALKRTTDTVPHAWTSAEKIKQFFLLFASQSTRNAEVYPAIGVGVLLLVFVVFSLVQKKIGLDKRAYLFMGCSLFTFVAYVYSPHSVGGVGSIDIRLAYLPFLFLLLYLAAISWSNMSKNIFMFSAICISSLFLLIRFPYVMQASRIGEEIMTAKNYIADKSVILIVHNDDWQRLTSGDSLFQKDGSFIHFSDLLGAEKDKHLILINNYEAEINYFPVNWRAGKNPRASIQELMPGTYPPNGNLSVYEKQIQRKIDYVVLQNGGNAMSDTAQIIGLHDNFNQVYASENHVVMVHKRK